MTSTDDSEVRLSSGQRTKRSLLSNSALYSSLLTSFQQLEVVPTPEGLQPSVLEDYLTFLDVERTIEQTKTCLKSCSLIDDPNYLEFCVRRFLLHYSRCKDMLHEIADVHCEDIYLLMPKDLWPQQLHHCDGMIDKWLHKHYYSKFPPLIESSTESLTESSTQAATNNLSRNLDISFLVDDQVYSYAFVSGRMSKSQLYVVVSVTPASIASVSIDAQATVNSLITSRDIDSAWIDHYADDILRLDCVEHDKVVTPDTDLSNFRSIINFCWDDDLKCRTQDLHVKLTDNGRVWVIHR